MRSWNAANLPRSRGDEPEGEWVRELLISAAPRAGMDVESESAGDFAGWVRQVNAAVADAEQAAAGAGSWFSRSSACINAEGRVSQTINRVQNLTFGAKRPGFIPAEGGSQAWQELREPPSPSRYAAQSAISRGRASPRSGARGSRLPYRQPRPDPRRSECSLAPGLRGVSNPWGCIINGGRQAQSRQSQTVDTGARTSRIPRRLLDQARQILAAARDPARRTETERWHRPGVPQPAWEAALRRNAELADHSTRHRRRAAWVPIELPGLGGGANEYAS